MENGILGSSKHIIGQQKTKNQKVIPSSNHCSTTTVTVNWDVSMMTWITAVGEIHIFIVLICFNPIPVGWVSNWCLPAVFPLFAAWFPSESEQPDRKRVNVCVFFS